MMKNKLLVITGMLIVSLSSCDDRFFWNNGIEGYGEILTEHRTVGSYNHIELRSMGNIYLSQGEQSSIQIDAQENILDVIQTYVRNNTLFIEFKKDVDQHDGIDYYMSIPDIRGIKLTGVGSIDIENSFECDHIKFEITGAGNISTDNLMATSIQSFITGTGDIELKGSGYTEFHEIEITGTGNLRAFDLETEEVEIISTGVGNCWVHATNKLDVTITGIGNVYYKGNPELTIKNTGLGNVVNSN